MVVAPFSCCPTEFDPLEALSERQSTLHTSVTKNMCRRLQTFKKLYIAKIVWLFSIHMAICSTYMVNLDPLEALSKRQIAMHRSVITGMCSTLQTFTSEVIHCKNLEANCNVAIAAKR